MPPMIKLLLVALAASASALRFDSVVHQRTLGRRDAAAVAALFAAAGSARPSAASAEEAQASPGIAVTILERGGVPRSNSAPWQRCSRH